MAAYISFTFEELDDEDDTPCKCCRFNRGTDLPIPTDLGVDEIGRATKHFSASIFKDWTTLNAILKRYEGTIQKRWMKKNLKQRREILLRAWPGMSSTHRPDFKNLRAGKKQVPRSRTCMAEAYLWPYINLEDLQKRNLLLMFINSRGRNLPETFRLADVKAAHLGDGWHRGLTFADSLEDYCCPDHYVEDHDEDDVCMLFEQKHSPRNYGRTVTNHAKSLKMHQYKCLSRSHEGLLSLEIHNSTYRFLVECTKLILHDVPPNSFFLAPTAPEPAMLGLPGPNEYPSLSTHSLESPYRVPQMLDLERLKMLVSSRRESAEDHVWLLKEDPLYFSTSLREYNEHNGDRVFGDEIVGTETCWNSVLGKMVDNAYEVFVFWDDIDRRLHNMAPIEVQLARANEKKVRLAEQDEEKWAAMLEVLWRLLMIPVGMLHGGVPTSPRLRSKYRWHINENSSSPAKGAWVITAKSSDSLRRLDTLFYSLHNEHQRELHGLLSLVQEIQYMFETDAEAASVIDPWIATHFADVALVAEIINAVDAMAPWFDEQKAAMIGDRHAVVKKVDKTRNLINKLKVGIRFAATDRKKLEFDPLDRDMIEYPAEKRPSKANTDQMILAEKKLDNFWQSMEKVVVASQGISLAKTIGYRLKAARELYRTEPWTEHSEPPSPTLTSPGSPPAHTSPKHGALAELDSNIHRPSYREMPISKKDILKTHAKIKIKTHGTPAAPDPRRVDPFNQEMVPDAAPTAKVGIPKRAFKVFTALLPSPVAAQQQRPELPWDDLLFAFNAIGLQPVKLYGSVWMFRPVQKGETAETDAGIQTVGKLELSRSFQLHEPKEVRRGAKIPKAMVRTFGRRLKHAYGWEVAEDIFACE